MSDVKQKLPGRWNTDFDENGKTVKVVYEASFRRLLGYEDAAAFDDSDDPWFESIHPDDRAAAERAYSEAIKKHAEEFDYDVKYRMKTASGEYRWFHDYARCIRREDGSLRRFEGVVFDIQDIIDRQEKQLLAANRHEKLRADSLAFIMKNDDLEAFVGFFSGRVLELYGCDQVIYRDCEDRMILKDKPGTPPLDFSLCKDCPHFAFDAEVYRDGFTAMDDCSEGWKGVPVHKDCPVGASLTYLVYEDERVFGYIALHYLAKTHEFSEYEKETFNSLARFLSMVLSRRKHQLAVKESLVFSNYFIDTFVSTYLVNLDTGVFRIHSQTAELKKKYPWAPDFQTAFDSYADNDVHPDDRRAFKEFFNLGNLKKLLREKPLVTYAYRDISDGVEKYYGARIVRGADEHLAAFAFADLTDETKREQKRALDEMETKRLKAREQELMHAEFRASAVAYLTEHEGDVKSFLGFFADRLRKLINCDQVIYRGANGEEVVSDSPALGKDFALDQSRCRTCPYFDMNSPVYRNGVSEVPDLGKCEGEARASEGCPVKSSLVRIISLDGKRNGYLAIHYILKKHDFTDSERRTLEEFANLLSISLSRFVAREQNAELQRELKLKQKIEEQQKQLEEALSMAQAANRAKTMFLNNMSHDIRTPMNAIIGFTGLAASHLDSKALVKDYLGKISQSSDHLLSLINDVLDMARIESGKMNLHEQPESLPDVIHSLRNIIQSQVSDKQLDFYIDCCDVKDENIVCDRLRLSQVLLNVLSNAVKYTPTGGTVSLRIREEARKVVAGSGSCSSSDSNATTSTTTTTSATTTTSDYNSSTRARYVFTVKDNGVGMSAEYLKEVFDPFSRAKNTTASGVQGTGLGMAITKNIVDMMGGEIDVRSEVGKGTEVTITFDFALGEVEKTDPQIKELVGAKALVADDDVNSCLSVSQTLEEIGMSAEWCTSGKEAVIRAKSAHGKGAGFRVYIIDWLMPDMNGIETVRRIRKVIGKDMPIIILTAYDWSDIEAEAIEAGVTAFIAKPLFASELRKVLVEQVGEMKVEKRGGGGVEVEKRGGGGQWNIDSDHLCPPPPNHSTSSSIRHVLLVEDNEINREIAVIVLTEQGFDVDIACNGAEAVEKIKQANDQTARQSDGYPYDLVLMDIQMPVMNGYEATRAIRDWEVEKLKVEKLKSSGGDESSAAQPFNSSTVQPFNSSTPSRIPIIALSANAFAEDVAASLEAGMDAHLSKPIKVKELVDCLSKFGSGVV